MHGWLNINKPLSITSHDVVYKARKILKTKKIGHCGTLDPLAEGVLVLAVGNATRLIQFLTETKKYIAKIKFGEQTNTYDREGSIINKKEFINFSRNEFESCLNKFIGKIKQKPPIFSAIKVNGKKLYQLARKNIEIDIKEREIEIFDIKIINYDLPYIEIEVFCKSGTYIRSLANDIGLSLNTFAYLYDLKRTESNNFFEIKNSINIENISKENFIDIDKPITNMDTLFLNDNELNKFLNGQKIFTEKELNTKFVKIYDNNNILHGIGIFDNKFIQPKINFPI